MSYNKEYSKYLHTKEWIARRDKIREKRKVCEICGRDDRLQVHHLNYDNLGNEKDEDLMLLCETCHQYMHKDKVLIINNVNLQECLDNNNSKQLLMEIMKKLDLAVVCFTNPKDELLNKRYFDIE